MRVCVTGATGFVGGSLVPLLTAVGHRVVGISRKLPATTPLITDARSAEIVVGPELGSDAQWCELLDGVEGLLHLAARVHIMREVSGDPLEEFRRVNLVGTERLARQAAQAGVRRFVYLSTIKVNGERTLGEPFRETDIPAPEDPYAISKWEAEQALRRVSEETGLEVVIVRPPLVYGPGVKGNLLRLLSLVRSGVPLPLASIGNLRSLLSLGNLVDLIRAALEHPRAAGEVFLAADGEDLSTPELIRRIARSMGKTDRLFHFPPALLQVISRLAGKKSMCERLCGSLSVDASKARTLLGWHPVSSVDESIDDMVRWFLSVVDSTQMCDRRIS